MPELGSVVNFFPTPFEDTIAMTLGGTITPGAATVPVDGMGNYSNGEIVVFVVDPATTIQQVFTGTVSGSDVVNCVWTEGTNVEHLSGANVIDYVSATTVGMISTGVQVEHTQTGHHKPLYDINGKLWLDQGATASAVNNLKVANAATGFAPIITAEGTDSAIGLWLTPKGSGSVVATSAILANTSNPVWQQLAFAQVTTTLTTTATTMTQLTGLTVTVTMPSNVTRVRVTATLGYVNLNNSPKQAQLSVWDGTVGSGTQLNGSNLLMADTNVNNFFTVVGYETSPASGSKTYNVGWTSDFNGGVTTTAQGGSTTPLILEVEIC